LALFAGFGTATTFPEVTSSGAGFGVRDFRTSGQSARPTGSNEYRS